MLTIVSPIALRHVLAVGAPAPVGPLSLFTTAQRRPRAPSHNDP